MIGITLKDVLAIPLLKDSTVLAGQSNLNSFVKGIAVAEVPDIVRFAKKDTIYLSTLFAFKDEGSLEALIKGLKQKGAAALFVKPKRFFGEVPKKAVEAASRLDFPLVEVDESVMWSDLIRVVLERILEEESREKAERNLVQAIMENSVTKETESIWQELFEFRKDDLFRIGVINRSDGKGQSIAAPDELERKSKMLRLLLSSYFTRVLMLPLTERFVFLAASKSLSAEFMSKVTADLSKKAPDSIMVLSKPFKHLTEAHERLKKVLLLEELYSNAAGEEKVILEEQKEEDIIFSGLLNSRDVEELAQSLISKLRSALSEEATLKMLWTVFVYLKSDLNQKKTAERLKVHVNTVKYRLSRFQEIAEINLASSSDLLKTYVLLKVMQLKGFFAKPSKH